jgi:hypothetical protein
VTACRAVSALTKNLEDRARGKFLRRRSNDLTSVAVASLTERYRL